MRLRWKIEGITHGAIRATTQWNSEPARRVLLTACDMELADEPRLDTWRRGAIDCMACIARGTS